MAKRKTPAKKAREPRPTVLQSPESLAKIADALISSGGRMKALAEDMRSANFDKLQMKNYDSLRRGMQWVDNFCAAGIRILREAQEQRNDFSAGGKNGVRLADTESD